MANGTKSGAEEAKTQAAITAVWEHGEDEQRRQDQSHWRGVGRWADDVKWRNLGRASLKRLKLCALALGRPLPTNPVVLEWGPGGGANLHAFRNLARVYVGIDISGKNLDEARRMLAAEEPSSVTFAPVLLAGPPRSVVGQFPPADIFLSTACFQHFPSKAYGAEVLRAIAESCAPRAYGLIQIRYDNGDEAWRPVENLARYEEMHIRATSYRLDEFWTLSQQAGFEPITIGHLNTSSNYATFALQRV